MYHKNEMFQSLPVDCHWIMTGDFNMVENPLDRSTLSCSQLMGLKEEPAWAEINNKYNNEDYVNKIEGPLYSWDNLRNDGIKVLATLNEFNSFSSSIQNPSFHITHYKIMGDSTFSNHHRSPFKLTSITMPYEAPRGKPMKYSFMRLRNQLKHYEKLFLHRCHYSLNCGR